MVPPPPPEQSAAPEQVSPVEVKNAQKTVQKPGKKKGPLPLWTAQFAVLLLYSGVIAGLTVGFDKTSGNLKSAYDWLNRTLEKLSLPQ